MRNERAVICGFSVLIFRGIGFWEKPGVHCALCTWFWRFFCFRSDGFG